MVREYRHGRPLAEAIRAVKERLSIDSFTLFSSAVLVSLERGGRIQCECLPECWWPI